MSALVFRSFNGTVHTSIEHGEAKSSEPVIGEELGRVELHPLDAEHLSIDALCMAHQGDYMRALRRVSA